MEERRQKMRIRWNKREERKKEKEKKKDTRGYAARYIQRYLLARERERFTTDGILSRLSRSPIFHQLSYSFFSASFREPTSFASPSFPSAFCSLPITLFCPSYKTVYLV